MALRFIDSFDHYATADLTEKYDAIADTPSIAGSGRFGSLLSCTDGNTPDLVRKILDSQATWIIGVAIKIPTYSAADKPLIRLVDSATTQLTLWYQTGTGKLYVVSAFGTSAVTAAGLNQGTWYYVELKVTIGNSGSYELRVNEVNVLSASGVDTQASGNASADRFELTSGSSSGTSTARQFDDLYVCDGTGSTNNDFLGDVRVECVTPNGNGNSSQLDGSDGNTTDNYLLVDETTPDDDTTYVESSDVGDKDTYAYSDLTTITGTVYGVQPVPNAKKTDAGTRTICNIARLSGTEVDSANHTLTTAYKYFPSIYETKPGGGAWSVSDVNSAEFGVKVTA